MTMITRAVAWLISLFIALFNVVGTPTIVRKAPLRVCAYIVVGGADSFEKLDKSHLDGLTDIIFIGSTASFNTEGEVSASRDFGKIVEDFRSATEKNGTRLYATIFGPGATTDENIEAKFESQAARHKLAFDSGILEDNIKSFLETYGLDGINFDYEFPGNAQREKEFSDFLVSLDETLGDEYLITAAVSSGWCKNTTKEAIKVLDSVQLMDYDLWDRIGQHSTIGIGKGCVKELLEVGFSKEQIDLGLAFYARPTTQDSYWYEYRDYYDKMDRYGFAPDDEHGLTASFNTPRDIFLKTYWAKRNGLGGVFVWNYASDVPADNSASLFNAIYRAKG